MQHIKVCNVVLNVWHSILVLTLLVSPLCLMADQQDSIPEPQKTVIGQNQVQTPRTQQKTNTLPDISYEEQDRFLYTVFLSIFGVLLLGILILLIAIFHTHRSFRKLVENRLEHPNKDNRLNYLVEKINTLSESRINKRSETFEGAADYSKDLLSDLKHLLEILVDENRNIQRSLEGIATNLVNNTSSQDGNSTNQSVKNSKTSTDSLGITVSSKDSQNEHDEPLSQVLQAFRNVYNSRQKNQLQNYQPSYQIQVANTLERREDPNEPPIFETNERGKLWAFYIEDEKLYAVVPAYSLVLERSVYGPGGFSEVFECPDFNFLSHYKNLRVIKPGIFKPDSTQQQWTLIEKGKIDLGSAE